jgi:ferredoxin
VPLNYDCKGGSCGLCKVRVVQGQYQQVLEPSISCGADEVLACCIQPTSALVLSADIQSEELSPEQSAGLISMSTTHS